MSWFLLGIALVVGAIFLARWYVSASPSALYRALRWLGLGLAVAIGLFLLASGRFQFLWMALFGLLPWVARLRMLRNLAKAARGPSRGQTSTVRTRFVVMRLDHDTGEMDGEVLEGAHKGRKLSEMTLEEVLDVLHAAMQTDLQSVQVLHAYLDRTYEDWREAADGMGDERAEDAGGGGRGDRARRNGRMSREEAYEVLGLAPGASEAEIKAAHRRLIRKYHPDHGGSDYVAAKINEAKDVLLGE